MAATKKKNSETPTSIRVEYDLLDLPTAQHKAGLAGLVLQVEAMRGRKLPAKSIPEVKVTGVGRVEAVFTKESLCALFNELYDAKKVVVEAGGDDEEGDDDEKKNVAKPGRRSKSTKTPKTFEVVRPEGHFFRVYFDGEKEAWLHLWREMLWKIPRGQPTTRNAFNRCADGKSSEVGEKLWDNLIEYEQAQADGESRVLGVAGSLMLGAQDCSAEGVPLCDRTNNWLLLHFWQLTARTFVPETIDAEGMRKTVGYVIAVPEIADIQKFCDRYKRLLDSVSPKKAGYRPAESVISVPEEGALEFMEHLERVVGAQNAVGRSETASAVSGVEFFHMERVKKIIKMAKRGRIPPSDKLLRGYDAIRSSSRNLLFRRARVLALLRENKWYEEFGQMLQERDWPMFVVSADTPRGVPSFAWDALVRFKDVEKEEQKRKVKAMENGEPRRAASLESLVFRLVRQYVRVKTDDKSTVKYASFKDKKVKDAKGRERVSYPEEYTKAQERVTSDLFLGMRSRRDEDFVRFFTDTVGSVAQGGNLSDESDFSVIALALLDEEKRKHVKTLAMLATSAASFASSNSTEEQNEKETE